MVCHLDFPNNPFRQFPKAHYSSPALAGFQHSNWGEAPKFFFDDSRQYLTIFAVFEPGFAITYPKHLKLMGYF